MANKDDRSNNAERIEKIIQNTEGNLKETENVLNSFEGELSSDERKRLNEKKQQREESLNVLREELKDEQSFQADQHE
ncbi:hypothetical protein BTS2_3548 [Bacillus sp. TS-2]|nr:hypothetical protein BTS2_3548 [Bacillus sp. TS-2]